LLVNGLPEHSALAVKMIAFILMAALVGTLSEERLVSVRTILSIVVLVYLLRRDTARLFRSRPAAEPA
jgi:hypothetical protein